MKVKPDEFDGHCCEIIDVILKECGGDTDTQQTMLHRLCCRIALYANMPKTCQRLEELLQVPDYLRPSEAYRQTQGPDANHAAEGPVAKTCE